MTKEQKKRVRLIYGILLGAAIIAAGICLMAACIQIYSSGSHPFSREAVAAHFAPISAPVYLCLAMVIGGFFLDLFLPAEPKKLSAGRQDGQILEKLQRRADLSACGEPLRGEIMALRKGRLRCRNHCAMVLAVCAGAFLIYALNGEHFVLPDINGSMIGAMKILLPCLILSFACAVFRVYYDRRSIRREIALLKQVPTKKSEQTEEKAAPLSKEAVARYAFLLLGLSMLLYGFFAGGTADVLTKAINICTECVGLG